MESKDTLKVILLGAGPSVRSEVHTALMESGYGSRVLDWLLQAYAEYNYELQFVVGYNLDQLESRYPDYKYVHNKDWDSTGATGSLFCSDLPLDGKLIVSYSDILYRKSLVSELENSSEDITVVVDSAWKDRYQGRSEEDLESSEKVNLANGHITRLGQKIHTEAADAEFIGLVSFKGEALKLLNKFKTESQSLLEKTKISFLVEEMRVRGLKVGYIDVSGDWAELDDPRDLAHFVLGTKAQTLDRLAAVVSQSTILDQYTFKVKNWNQDANEVVAGIMEQFRNTRIVARSSALTEDGFASANAGAYDSILNIDSSSAEAIKDAIVKVIDSYPDTNPSNQVLVQPMLTDVRVSGVGFTRTLSKGAPYYVINYDDQSGSTESITSGTSKSSKTFVLRRDKLEGLSGPPAEIIQLCKAFREVEDLVNYDSLDIEFAIDSAGNVFILQVRPIAVDHSEWSVSDEEVFQLVSKAEEQFASQNKPTAIVKGESALYGLMPDWNPAEIIGVNPGRLAHSLYQEIIMNDVWSAQRAEYGYRDVRPVPLLRSFAGHPYVDVRASFNSFIPRDVEDGLAEKLVDFYLEYLKDHPEYHDKVEFDVVPTCYDLNFQKWRDRFGENGFNAGEIESLEKALRTITNQAIFRNEEFFTKVSQLEERLNDIMKDSNPLRRAYYLLEDCQTYGTLPFSHLARSAFVAVSLLRTAVETDIISNQAKEDFLSSIESVSHSFTQSISDLASGAINMQEFLLEYGHIRPGTYDITSKNYREDADYYISPLLKNVKEHQASESAQGNAWEQEKQAFYNACKAEGIEANLEELESFMRGAIEGREYAKFVFSKNLSLAMEAMTEYGEALGLDREAISHISWGELYKSADLELEPDFIANHLQNVANSGSRWKEIASSVELPPLLTGQQDFWWFYYPDSQANFIGTGSIIADCVDISHDFDENTNLEGKIALIPRADPGYEWLFGRNIGGLITMYGGANSHMAIRAAEFNLPAAIGVGEKEFQRIAKAKILNLDAANRKIEILQ
ncbi:MAG: PEP-utilizing enzyme [Bacteroidetes bacterium]|nr:PEP-utilizing enzyme [Bacteroidota bacterium]